MPWRRLPAALCTLDTPRRPSPSLSQSLTLHKTRTSHHTFHPLHPLLHARALQSQQLKHLPAPVRRCTAARLLLLLPSQGQAGRQVARGDGAAGPGRRRGCVGPAGRRRVPRGARRAVSHPRGAVAARCGDGGGRGPDGGGGGAMACARLGACAVHAAVVVGASCTPPLHAVALHCTVAAAAGMTRPGIKSPSFA